MCRRGAGDLMGRRSTVEKLDANQQDFVIRSILNGGTDREISAAFESKFDLKLPKTSLHRWRKKAGDELADRYRMQRFRVTSFVEKLKTEGIEIGEDKYHQIIENLENHLLTAERDLIAQNPVKLLFARQEDERLRLKRDEFELKKQQHEFEREKFEKTQRLQADKFRVASEAWKYILAYFTNLNSSVADDLTAHSPDLIKGLGEYIETI